MYMEVVQRKWRFFDREVVAWESGSQVARTRGKLTLNGHGVKGCRKEGRVMWIWPLIGHHSVGNVNENSNLTSHCRPISQGDNPDQWDGHVKIFQATRTNARENSDQRWTIAVQSATLSQASVELEGSVRSAKISGTGMQNILPWLDKNARYFRQTDLLLESKPKIFWVASTA